MGKFLSKKVQNTTTFLRRPTVQTSNLMVVSENNYIVNK